MFFLFFFFNDTATTEIYTLSLHDALPISAGRAAPDRAVAAAPGPLARRRHRRAGRVRPAPVGRGDRARRRGRDRKSTRLNSSHGYISYAVFCLKKKQ